MEFLLRFIRKQKEYLQKFCDHYDLGDVDTLTENNKVILYEALIRSMEVYKRDVADKKEVDIPIELAVVEAVMAWRKNKQVYSFDKDFVDVLCDTTLDFKIEEGVLDTLPYQVFALEIGDHYSLVSRYRYDDGVDKVDDLHIMCLDPNNEMETWAWIYPLSSGRTVQEVLDKKINRYSDFDEGVKRQIEAIQCTLYLAAENAKIVESELTKQTYRERKSERIRDKFSEVRKWDAGIRINYTSFPKKQVIKESKDIEIQGSPKRPHWRKAHWMTVWTGKGKTIPKLRWIQPIRVHSDLPIPVTDTVVKVD